MNLIRQGRFLVLKQKITKFLKTKWYNYKKSFSKTIVFCFVFFCFVFFKDHK